MNIVLDTNILHSYLDKEDSNHLEARNVFKNFKREDKMLVPLIVVFELCAGSPDVESLLKFLEKISDKFIQNTKLDIKFFDNLDFKTRNSLKAADCAILSICYRTNAKLLTFDRKLKKVYDKIFNENNTLRK